MKKLSLMLLFGFLFLAPPSAKAQLKGGSIDFKREKAAVIYQAKKKKLAFAISGREIVINKGAAYRQRRGTLFVISPYAVSKEKTAFRDPMGVLIRLPKGAKDKIVWVNKQGEIKGGIGWEESEIDSLVMKHSVSEALNVVDDLFDFVDSDVPYSQIQTLSKLALMSEDDNGGFGPIGLVAEDDNGGFGPIGTKSEDDNGGFGPIGFIAEDDNGGFGPIGTKSEDDNGGFGPIGMAVHLPEEVNATCEGRIIYLH